MKVCNKCKKEKKLLDFQDDKRNRDGKQGICRKCCSERLQKYSRSPYGLISKIYSQQKHSSKKRNHKMPSYTKEDLVDWVFKQQIFFELYANWCKNNYNKKLTPSVDRIDDYKGYSFENIRICTWEENNKKFSIYAKNGLNNKQSKKVYQYDLNGNLIAEFYSHNQASRETGFSQSSITKCANGNIKQSCGFVWSSK